MRWTANSLLAWLLVGSAIPLVFFAAVGLVSGVVIFRLLHALRSEKHTYEVLNQARLLNRYQYQLRLVIQTEPAGQLPRSARFHNLTTRFRDDAERLAGLLAGNPAQQQAALALLAAHQAFADEARKGAPFADLEQRLAELEDYLVALINQQEARLGELHETTEAQTRQTYPVIAGAVALGLLFTWAGTLSAARCVTGPLGRLREATGLLLAGSYRSVPPEGPEEIAELIVMFNHMALTLSQRARLLEDQELRYQTYIAAVAHILWTADAGGMITGELPTWQAYTGQGADDVRGAGWLDAVHPEDSERVRAAWGQCVAGRSLFETEFRLRRSDGEYHPFHCKGVPIINPDGSVREWIGTCTDVTETRRRQELEQAKEAAEAASRAKSEFLTRMSHELRTPLNAVIGMSKMLTTQRFGPLTAKQADYVSDITRAGEHLLDLINDILDLAKVESGKMDVQPDAFALGAGIDSLAKTLRPLAGSRGIALRLCPSGTDGEVKTDPARLRQVLYNLLSNAIKFTERGGQVTVSWEWVAAPRLDAPAVPEPRAAAFRVAVADTGVGIAAENQELIWDEFRQVARPKPGEVQGTGLGLALTRRLVSLLGGSIGLVSTPGQGSTFTFALPRAVRPTPAAAAEAEPPGERPVALVVEDHPPTNRLLRDWLSSEGLAAVPAYDGETAVHKAAKLRPALIVLDVCLPVLDGWQVLSRLKSDPATAGIPVVIVTMNDERRPVSSLPVHDFFIKPVDRDVFLGRLRARMPGLFNAGHGPRVLIVDDDPGARKVLADLLRADGASVIEAANGREALEQIEQKPDLVLLDLMMPEVDGFEVVEHIRSRPELEGLPVMVVTAAELDGEALRRLRGRTQALLQKDLLTPQRLREHLRALGVQATGRG